jgi:hypothetical protein
VVAATAVGFVKKLREALGAPAVEPSATHRRHLPSLFTAPCDRPSSLAGAIAAATGRVVRARFSWLSRWSAAVRDEPPVAPGQTLVGVGRLRPGGGEYHEE